MTSRDFCYWLQGYFEIIGAEYRSPLDINKIGLSAVQTKCVQNHLALVFKHEIDPSYGGDQEELQEIHDGIPNNIPIGQQPSVPNYLLRC